MKISRVIFAVVLLCCYTSAVAPHKLPPGTALPIMLSTTVNARNDKAGQKIEGKLMQEVQLPSGIVIKKGARVIGQVVSIQKPSRIVLQFTELQEDHQTIPLNASLRALAASQSVFQAGIPADASTAEQSDEWVTQQVGGDFVFRGRGYVSSNQGKVGFWTGDGVVGRLSPGEDCPDSEGNGQEQALWVFSTTACGVYGYDKKLTIAHDGQTAPLGQITLEFTGKESQVRGGSGWLLVVNPEGSGALASH
ncbi:MAG TPA: hypothetical protein VLV47_00145 [Candidatus Bathyarchaeia archaeon]|nr:hypothetical protein [Candidatus Bathyarchaeia archaeon]